MARGFWYTRYPRKGERPDDDLDFYQQVYYHKLGTPESEDKYVIGKDVPEDRGDRAARVRTTASAC